VARSGGPLTVFLTGGSIRRSPLSQEEKAPHYALALRQLTLASAPLFPPTVGSKITLWSGFINFQIS
jgi:hypothetical protein